MTIPTLSYNQNVALSQFLEQNNLTEKSLYTALNKAKVDAENAEFVEAQKVKNEKYCGKYFRSNVGGVNMYYKVLAPYGFDKDSVSCLYFGLNPELDASYDYHGKITEVLLRDDTDFFSGSVRVHCLDCGEEITGTEFAEAFRIWTEKVLKLEWNV